MKDDVGRSLFNVLSEGQNTYGDMVASGKNYFCLKSYMKVMVMPIEPDRV